MPINTNLNISPYYDDFDVEKQFYKIMFKPAFAVQARELTQLQSILQNQIEQFGDNIYKEGSIIKGSNFTEIQGLKFVKLQDGTATNFDPTLYISGEVTESIGGADTIVDVVYKATGSDTNLSAKIISAERGFQTRPPNLNTFFITYLTTNEDTATPANTVKAFDRGETLTITREKFVGGNPHPTEPGPTVVATINVTDQTAETGSSYGIQSSTGIIFQKGHFLFTAPQTLIVDKYSNAPDGVSVGYTVTEELISYLQDPSLYDNAIGSVNQNAPGADRLKLTPTLTALNTILADTSEDFFTLIRYQNGNAVALRDIAQFNVLGEEFARRTYEESGNYIVDKFDVRTDRRGTDLQVLVGPGKAYVKGYRVENLGERDFIIPNITSTTVQENTSVSFNYGSYIAVTGHAGTLDINGTQANLQTSGGANIGTAFVKNIFADKVYLYGIKMTGTNSFASVERISTGSGHVTIAAGSTLQEVRKAPLIFDTGVFSTKSISDIAVPIREKITGVSASTSAFTLTSGVGYDFPAGMVAGDILVIDNNNQQFPVSGSIAYSVNNSQIDFSVTGVPVNPCTVYVDKRDEVATPHPKLSVSPYIKVTYAGGTIKYSLGFPDVYNIRQIVDSAGDDVTNSFRLKTNQKDTYYDISYMEFIPNRPEPATGQMTILLDVYQCDGGTGINFFTVDSYPVDDASATLGAGSIRSNSIPVYQGTNGRKYNLRECIDFRPHVDPDASADYTATSAGLAPVISGTVDDPNITFADTPPLTPALNRAATVDIENYLARIDLVTIDSYGRFTLLVGTEDDVPVPPKVPADRMVISQIGVPGFPALTPREAQQQGKNPYAVSVSSKGIENYTMKEINDLERRIDALEYYTQLNQLEQDTLNLQILDTNGLTRFKNGYIVDPFRNLNLANVENNDFLASVPFDREILQPALRTFPIDLKFKSSTNATIFPDTNVATAATLARNAHSSFIKQDYATRSRNCVSNFYSYVGIGELSPDHDNVHDTIGDPVTLSTDFLDPFQNFLDNLQQFVPLTGTTVTRTNRVETTTRRTLAITGEETKTTSGEFVSNVNFSPFARSREVKIYLSGLRPNTRHYFFFDKVAVNSNVYPGAGGNEAREVARYGAAGAAVLSDANGVLRAVFVIPAETFFVGDRMLEVVDVNAYTDIESASTSYGSLMYHAVNISVERTHLTMSTRIPEFGINTTVTERNLPRRRREPSRDRRRRGDPLSQTFFVKEDMTNGDNAIYASKVDLYFRKKSTTNGITVMLREVDNGYPAPEIIPFSQVHLLPSQVNISEDASQVTTVDFKAPVRLDANKEYAIVVMPDANDPDYLIFTSKVGEDNIVAGSELGQAVVQDWGDGVLFTSTNNRAWKSYQDEDLKFNLYRHVFSSNSGSVTFEASNMEFFTLSTWSGAFNVGEKVYAQRALSGSTSANVFATIGSNQVTGTALDDTYTAGDQIILADSSNTNKDIFTIASVEGATSMTLENQVWFTVSNGTSYPITMGECLYHNPREPEKLYLKNSNATGVDIFAASNNLTGLDSGTTGTISTVDNITIGYIQPKITKATDTITSTGISGRFVDANNVLASYNLPMKFADNNFFNRKGNIVYSKSNDVGGTQPFEITVTMNNGTSAYVSPFVDLETATLIAYQYRVSNSSTTTSKYISKTVELAENLDAEDMNVIMTAHRPTATDIKCYIKPQNYMDSSSFDSCPWIELELFEGVNQFCSDININDYREFKFRVPDSAKDGNDVIQYTSGAGQFQGYRKFAIKIELLSDNTYRVPTVSDYRGIALT